MEEEEELAERQTNDESDFLKSSQKEKQNRAQSTTKLETQEIKIDKISRNCGKSDILSNAKGESSKEEKLRLPVNQHGKSAGREMGRAKSVHNDRERSGCRTVDRDHVQKRAKSMCREITSRHELSNAEKSFLATMTDKEREVFSDNMIGNSRYGRIPIRGRSYVNMSPDRQHDNSWRNASRDKSSSPDRKHDTSWRSRYRCPSPDRKHDRNWRSWSRDRSRNPDRKHVRSWRNSSRDRSPSRDSKHGRSWRSSSRDRSRSPDRRHDRSWRSRSRDKSRSSDAKHVTSWRSRSRERSRSSDHKHEKCSRGRSRDISHSTDCRHDKSWRSRSRDRNRWKPSESPHRYKGWKVERKEYGELPCKYYNDLGYCKYRSGHPNIYGVAKMHICRICFYEERERRNHSEVDCMRIKLTSKWRKDEPCHYFNNVGACDYKSGHPSKCGIYSHVHICRFCLNQFGEKMLHSALHCKYKNNLRIYRRDSPVMVRFKAGMPARDEKPCNYYNNTGSCRLTSGHLNLSGITKQLHICRCCLEFSNKVKYHPALYCKLKATFTGGRKDSFSNEKPPHVTELPCRHYNSGDCELESDHRPSSRDIKKLHICRYCFDYRGEKHRHSEGECTSRKADIEEPDTGSHWGKSKEDSHDVGRVKNKEKRHRSKDKKDKRSHKSMLKKLINIGGEKDDGGCNEEGEYSTEEGNTSDEFDNRGKGDKFAKVHLTDDGDISIHMNPEDRFPDETEMKAIRSSTPAKNKSISSKLFDQIIHCAEMKVENIERKIKALEKKEEAKTIKQIGKNNKSKLTNDINVQVDEHNREKSVPKQNRNNQMFRSKLGSDGRRDKKRRKLEVSTPQAIINIVGTETIKASTIESINGGRDLNFSTEMKKISPAPARQLDLPTETGNKDLVINNEEIMRKIEMLEKLYLVECQKLREARQQKEIHQSNRQQVEGMDLSKRKEMDGLDE